MSQKRPKRPHADSVDRMVQIVANVAKGPLQPPEGVTLRDQDEPFWLSVLDARARDDWTDHDLRVAAQLARCMADIEAEQLQLNAEGNVQTKDGVQSVNPRIALIGSLVSRQLAYRRALRMGGYSEARASDLAERRALERNAETIAKRITEHDTEHQLASRYLS